jgi:hypothetical protein
VTEFEVFWHAYPRKVGKLAALKVWNRHRPPIADVLATLAWQVEEWDDPMYIPHPKTWISQGRWMDEPVARLERADDYGHVPPCDSVKACIERRLRDGRALRAVK